MVAVKDVKKVLTDEFQSMTTDHLFLGWCYGRRYMPMCTHAYAITRSAAVRIVQAFDICFPHAIDAQLRQLSERGILVGGSPNQIHTKI